MVTPRGAGVLLSASQPRGKNTTLLLASMSAEGMGPALAVERSTTATVFETYDVGEVLALTLQKRQEIAVMDNLSAHKGSRSRKLLEERGCELLYLPPYSPDLKWDEKAEIKLH